MQVSNRIEGLTGGGSDGWDVFYRARAMMSAGTPVTELTIGEHDLRTDPSILAAMHAAAIGGHTGYASVPGVAALRDAVAARLTQRTGVATTRDNIVITPGGQAALFAAHMAVCDAGDVALYCDPYYATYPGTIRGAGAVPRAVMTRPEAAFQPSFTDIAKHARGARSILVNTPNNPTGVVYDRATVEAIARACCEYDLWCISDEVYDTQVWEGAHLSPRAMDRMEKRTLVVGSMSKSHAMTGSRVGWVAGPADVVAHMVNLATHTTYGVPGYIQDAALFALNEGPELEARVGAPFERRRGLAQALLAAQNVVKLVPSGGAMYLMLDCRATGLTGEDFANQLLDAHRIAVMPGESFGQAAAGHIRVAMTVEDAAFEAALSRILTFAQALAA